MISEWIEVNHSGPLVGKVSVPQLDAFKRCFALLEFMTSI